MSCAVPVSPRKEIVGGIFVPPKPVARCEVQTEPGRSCSAVATRMLKKQQRTKRRRRGSRSARRTHSITPNKTAAKSVIEKVPGAQGTTPGPGLDRHSVRNFLDNRLSRLAKLEVILVSKVESSDRFAVTCIATSSTRFVACPT